MIYTLNFNKRNPAEPLSVDNPIEVSMLDLGGNGFLLGELTVKRTFPKEKEQNAGIEILDKVISNINANVNI